MNTQKLLTFIKFWHMRMRSYPLKRESSDFMKYHNKVRIIKGPKDKHPYRAIMCHKLKLYMC